MSESFDLRQTGDVAVDTPTSTALADLAAELGRVTAGNLTLLVDSRPGWSVRYSLDIDGAQLAAWRRAAHNETTDTTDDYQWYRTILAAKCVDIRRDGTPVVDSAGVQLNFFNAELQRLLGVPAGAPSGGTEAVRRFYASDFATASTANRLIGDAGFGKAAREAADPTFGSSSV